MPLAYSLPVEAADAAQKEPPRSSALPAPLLARMNEGGLVAKDHVLVLGADCLTLALGLWQAGFTNVGCAPRNLDCVAHGITDSLIITGAPCGDALDRLLARARFSLRDRGLLFLHFAVARSLSLPRLYAQLTAAGLVVGDISADGRGGLWLSARARAALRVVGGKRRMAHEEEQRRMGEEKPCEDKARGLTGARRVTH
ncbi:hypothetical protein GCM10007301_08950 [Azorhizobium oxalatiphilum]|uniref:Uncharacterized protein n=1 Tax=Azorhizobium oxalatiphilum TaxID=980631 RepID=A0A917F4G3_9HYPH|nr:hypothetical protein [Azorhizobium oxalatiphilum]GGF51718.1 hypothetical protein GCM10007301_08950 [Azorhizobium oxalatiphilum]